MITRHPSDTPSTASIVGILTVTMSLVCRPLQAIFLFHFLFNLMQVLEHDLLLLQQRVLLGSLKLRWFGLGLISEICYMLYGLNYILS